MTSSRLEAVRRKRRLEVAVALVGHQQPHLAFSCQGTRSKIHDDGHEASVLEMLHDAGYLLP